MFSLTLVLMVSLSAFVGDTPTRGSLSEASTLCPGDAKSTFGFRSSAALREGDCNWPASSLVCAIGL